MLAAIFLQGMLVEIIQNVLEPNNSTPGPYLDKTQRDTCTPMFIAALFTIAKRLQQLKYTSTHEWKKEMWYIYAMKCYSAIEEWGNAICSNMDGPREYHTKWNKRKKVPYNIICTCSLKYGTNLFTDLFLFVLIHSTNRNRFIDIGNKHGYQRGKKVEEEWIRN